MHVAGDKLRVGQFVGGMGTLTRIPEKSGSACAPAVWVDVVRTTVTRIIYTQHTYILLLLCIGTFIIIIITIVIISLLDVIILYIIIILYSGGPTPRGSGRVHFIK